eukprot:COSAG02_NODE_105_length_36393_cov_15.694495_1_plen_183_part_00
MLCVRNVQRSTGMRANKVAPRGVENTTVTASTHPAGVSGVSGAMITRGGQRRTALLRQLPPRRRRLEIDPMDPDCANHPCSGETNIILIMSRVGFQLLPEKYENMQNCTQKYKDPDRPGSISQQACTLHASHVSTAGSITGSLSLPVVPSIPVSTVSVRLDTSHTSRTADRDTMIHEQSHLR